MPETRFSILLAFLLVAALLPALCAVAAEEPSSSSPLRWDKETVNLFRTLPILDEGRIKPLDTYAGFKLLKLNGRRSCKTPDGRTLTPTEWLLDSLFYPDAAQDYAIFSVDSAEVIVAIGILPHEKKRDRYCYRELKPGRDKLLELGERYAHVPPKERTIVQSQIVNLAQNFTEYEPITEYAQFALRPLKLEPCEAWSRIFPNATELRLSDVLKRAAGIHRELVSLERDKAPLSDERKRSLEAIRALLGALDEVRGTSRALALFPPVASSEKEWLTPADIVVRGFEGGARGDTIGMVSPIELLAAFEELARVRDDRALFKERAAAFHARVTDLATQRGEYGKINLEATFYKWKLFSRSLVFYVLAFVIVAGSWLMPKSRWLNRSAIVLIVISTVLLITGIAMRCIIRGRPPVTTLYETILFITAMVVVVSLFIEYLNRQRIAVSVAAILAVVGMFLANKYEAKEGVDTMPSMVAVLDTNFWLSTHVTTITMGYAAGLLAGALAHIYIFGKLLGLKKADPRFYETVTRMVYGVFCFGFFFAFIGTLLGGIWADQSWGRFWGWDPKENGALLIVLWQLAALHARGGGYIRDLGMNMAAVVCGMVIAFSWWYVNLLGVGLHSYGFSRGAFTSVVAFWTLEAIVLLLGALLWAKQPRTGITSTARK